MFHRIAHHSPLREPSPFFDARIWVKIARVSFLPLLPALVLFRAGAFESPPELEDLNRIHALSVAAALLAFLCRPRFSWRSCPSRQWMLLGLAFLFYGWVTIGFFRGEAREAAYPYCVLLLDGFLLFYALRGAARFYPATALALLATTQLAALTLLVFRPLPDRLVPQWNLEGSLTPMICCLALLGPVVLLVSRGRRFGGIRWWISTVLMGVCFIGFWTLRIETRLEEKNDPRRPAPPRRKIDVLVAARETFRSHVLTGVGLGAFERRLRGLGIGDLDGRSIVGIDAGHLPEPEASLEIEASKPAVEILAARRGFGGNRAKSKDGNPPGAKEKARLLLQSAGLAAGEKPSPALNSSHLFLLDLGSFGVSLAVVAFLFVFLACVYGVAGAPRSSVSLLVPGLLGLWASVAAEGVSGTALHSPYGILLFGCLGGLLWGTFDRLTREIREERENALEKLKKEKRPAASSPSDLHTEAKPLLEPWTEMDTIRPAAERKRARFRSENRSNTTERLVELLRTLLPKRWISALASILLAASVVQFTATPLKGLRAARAAESLDSASEERGVLLRRAAALHPFSTDLVLLLAEHLRERHARETLKGKLSDTELVSIQIQIESLFHKARDLDPYREDLYVIQARYHRERGQTYKMAAAVADGRRKCPRSLLLALWTARHARNAGDPLRLEIALRDALFLTGAGHKEIRANLLKRLAEHLDRRDDRPRATQAALKRFQSLPGDPLANEFLLRNSTGLSSTEMNKGRE